jgi:hypothetical protein
MVSEVRLAFRRRSVGQFAKEGKRVEIHGAIEATSRAPHIIEAEQLG